jgi:SAM-dependent methyltransferase
MEVTYDRIGNGYSNFRSTDPDIAAAVRSALGAAASVVNVGAGTGSYEACAPACIAIEPSSTMMAQRPTGSAPVMQGTAERLPLRTGSFDAAMALLTVHHWTDLDAGLLELRRVATRVVLLTFDAAVHDAFWLFADYLPEAVATSWPRPPAPDDIGKRLGGASVSVVPVSPRCRDGFATAYWKRPAAFLDPDVRACCSAFAELPEDLVEERMGRLATDLDSGRWQANHARLLDATSFDGGLRLVVTD